jgi:hypothetical protein
MADLDAIARLLGAAGYDLGGLRNDPGGGEAGCRDQRDGVPCTMIHRETAFLANVAEERRVGEATFGEGHGIDNTHRIVFAGPRTVECRACAAEIAQQLMTILDGGDLRRRMGEAERQRVTELFDSGQRCLEKFALGGDVTWQGILQFWCTPY